MDWQLPFFGAVLVADIVVDHACRKPEPEPWAGQLCLVTLIPNGLAILMTLKVILDVHHKRVDGMAGILILPGTLIFVAFLWLVYLYYSRFHRAKGP